mmetsp:Transcript_23091/g.75280  ORF Transcript_23091/g.75280 Transcript_23091/m.75280 type:complete len:223 (-) Transcript_23091:207-875(-)
MIGGAHGREGGKAGGDPLRGSVARQLRRAGRQPAHRCPVRPTSTVTRTRTHKHLDHNRPDQKNKVDHLDMSSGEFLMRFPRVWGKADEHAPPRRRHGRERLGLGKTFGVFRQLLLEGCRRIFLRRHDVSHIENLKKREPVLARVDAEFPVVFACEDSKVTVERADFIPRIRPPALAVKQALLQVLDVRRQRHYIRPRKLRVLARLMEMDPRGLRGGCFLVVP